MSLAASQYIKDFSDEIAGDINEYEILILYNEMYQHLKDFWNLVIQNFSNGQHMILQNHALVTNREHKRDQRILM